MGIDRALDGQFPDNNPGGILRGHGIIDGVPAQQDRHVATGVLQGVGKPESRVILLFQGAAVGVSTMQRIFFMADLLLLGGDHEGGIGFLHPLVEVRGTSAPWALDPVSRSAFIYAETAVNPFQLHPFLLRQLKQAPY